MVGHIQNTQIKQRQDEQLKAQSKTQRANKVMTATKQGYVTDTFINNKFDQDQVFIDASLPSDLTNKSNNNNNKNSDKRFLAMVGIPLIVLGAASGITKTLAVSTKRKIKQNSPKLLKFFAGEKLPPLPININLKTEPQFAAYNALRDPKQKTILGAMAVFAFSSAAFVMKNTVDGFKDIWVKKKDADIQRDYQEKMINIETRSFAGKKQVVRYLLDSNQKELKAFNTENNISFGQEQNNQEQEKQKKSEIKMGQVLIGAAALGGAILLIKNSLKNIRTIGQEGEKYVAKVKTEMINGIKGKTEKQLDKDKVAKQFVDLNLDRKEVENALGETRMKEGTKNFIKKKVENHSLYTDAHEMYGTVNKTSFFPYLDNVSAPLYNFVVHPSKHSGKLFAGLSAVASVGYAGEKFVEAHKEVQVKKANAETDYNMHDKLVKIELKNFMAKKNVAIKPLVQEYKNHAEINLADKEGLKTRYNGVMNEIKNGPPFIYD